ncbi:hypothetical protein UlMin_036512 [Ulmus minor]
MVDEDYVMDEDPADIEIERNTTKPKVGWFGSKLDAAVESDSDYGDSDELDSLDDDDDDEYVGPRKRGEIFLKFDKHTDLKDPQFKPEQYFPNLDTIRKVVRNYSIINLREVIWEKNYNKRVRVRCQVGCDWLFKFQFYRTKAKALKLVEGSVEDQFNLLHDYCLQLRLTNPGSSMHLQTSLNEAGIRVFERVYVCLTAYKKGWIEGCRPIVGLDGYFIKASYSSQLPSTVGLDANNSIFPVMYVVVEAENYQSWK